MADVRLIDANALSDELSTLTITITGLRAGKGILHEYMTEYRKSVLRIVDDAPTIDAVPVVRCKDCKYYDRDECQNPYIFMSDEAHLYTQPDDFCSYGERKENERLETVSVLRGNKVEN